MFSSVFVFFFFQAEDGIRDIGVTGVQTCALPICPKSGRWRTPGDWRRAALSRTASSIAAVALPEGQLMPDLGRNGLPPPDRSEERRVGKECRSRWSPYH